MLSSGSGISVPETFPDFPQRGLRRYQRRMELRLRPLWESESTKVEGRIDQGVKPNRPRYKTQTVCWPYVRLPVL